MYQRQCVHALYYVLLSIVTYIQTLFFLFAIQENLNLMKAIGYNCLERSEHGTPQGKDWVMDLKVTFCQKDLQTQELNGFQMDDSSPSFREKLIHRLNAPQALLDELLKDYDPSKSTCYCSERRDSMRSSRMSKAGNEKAAGTEVETTAALVASVTTSEIGAVTKNASASSNEEVKTQTTPSATDDPLAAPYQQTRLITCLYEKCIGKGRNIDPNEKRFMRVFCSAKCHVPFHRGCLREFMGEKVNMKNYFDEDRKCMTPDCHGAIVTVKTFDMEGNVTAEHMKEREEKEERGEGRRKRKFNLVPRSHDMDRRDEVNDRANQKRKGKDREKDETVEKEKRKEESKSERMQERENARDKPRERQTDSYRVIPADW